MTNKQKITSRVCTIELLLGLAEESAELTQAALKLRRVFDGNSPTPKTEEECINNLYEEIADTLLFIDVLQINMSYIEQIKEQKIDRWIARLDNDKCSSENPGYVDRPL